MKKKSKNILMIIILMLSLGGLIFTVFTIKSSLNNSTNMSFEVPPEGENLKKDEEPPKEMQEVNDLGDRKTEMNVKDYFVLGLFSLTFSVTLMYLILSKFNTLSNSETLASGSKKLVFILGVIVLTGLLTYLSSIVVTNHFVKVENGGNSENITYDGNTLINTAITENEKEYSSTVSNQNAILASGEVEVHINNSTLTKTGDSSSGDSTSFYGINSGVLAKDKVKLFIDNMTITTDAVGANGVFSFGGRATTNNSSSDGTTITITNSRIKTSKDNSGGIMLAGGGILNAVNLDIETSGISSAAIRSDRGGGTMDVNLGTYKTTGVGSPAIYSTANISVSNATLNSEASEGVIIEGANSINLNKVNLTDTNNKLSGKSTTYKNIFIYQSMSGDAKEGSASFKATESSITTNKGDTIYVTNTKASIELTKNTFVNNDSDGCFLRIQKDSWGKSGSNGGDVILSLTDENISGNIVVDSISTLDMTLTNSSLETAINSKNEAKSIKVTMDKKSSIKLTGDTYITSLTDEDTTYSNINFNGYKLYVNKAELKKGE